jgi:hypothetical protein
MQANGLIQVRQDTTVLKPGIEMDGKVVETWGSVGMTMGMSSERSSMQVNGLIQVRQDTPLLKPAVETQGKFAEVQRLIRMTTGTALQHSSQFLNIVSHLQCTCRAQQRQIAEQLSSQKLQCRGKKTDLVAHC